MAEKRKLLAEMEKVFRKVEEGVEVFEETMTKIQEANSDNQREKFQDDLKKEIKKLQRQRDQIKAWQNSNDVKDKERLEELKKTIEEKMQRFKSIERVNKTKPHSKMGLNAEEKIDPKVKERVETIEWLQSGIGKLTEQSDGFEAKLENLGSSQSKKKKGKDDKKKMQESEELRHCLERHKFHIQKLELILRLVDNESLGCEEVNNLKEDILYYIDKNQEVGFEENEYLYDDLSVGDTAEITQALGSITNIGTLDENVSETSASPAPSPSPLQKEGVEPVAPEPMKTRHSSGGVEHMWNRSGGLRSSSTHVGSRSAHSTPLKLTSQASLDSALSTPPPAATPPLPPGIPYNIAAQTRSQATVQSVSPVQAIVQEEAVVVSEATRSSSPAQQQSVQARPTQQVLVNGECSERTSKEVLPLSVIAEQAVAVGAAAADQQKKGAVSVSLEKNGPQTILNDSAMVQQLQRQAAYGVDSSGTEMIPQFVNEFLNRASSAGAQQMSQEAQNAKIPPCLGASPLGRVGAASNHGEIMQMVEGQSMSEGPTSRMPLPMDCEKLKVYTNRNPCQTPNYYPQAPPLLAETLEYWNRLTPETLFFVFYYMEGTKAQYLAARALKKQAWRFHKKYLMWFQRHEEPTLITDEYEQGTYVYFDFEKWAQRKKEGFTFEYRYLEDRDLN